MQQECYYEQHRGLFYPGSDKDFDNVLVFPADCRRQDYSGIPFIAEPLQIQRKGLIKVTGRTEELAEFIK